MNAIEECETKPLDPSRLALTFEIHRIPFFLEPDMGESETEMHMERMYRKFGRGMSYEEFLPQWPAIKAPMALAPRGREVGTEFNEARVVSDTMPSHTLIRWAARTKGLAASEALYDVLNRKHFLEGKKLNDIGMLVESIEEVESTLHIGLDAVEAKQFLESGTGAVEVRQIVSKVHSMGVHSIPTFIFDAE